MNPTTRAVFRTDMRVLRNSRDFWIPLVLISVLFFVIIPALAIWVVTNFDAPEVLKRVTGVLDTLPREIREASPKNVSPQAQAAWSLAVFAFAPLAVIIPVTIASAIGAHTFVGERERGTGEFLAHSPASEVSIYRGKLLATLVPAFATELIGFMIYSLVVNLIVGPKVGGWFFPTAQWWVMVLWMLPPFIAIAVCLIVVVSAKVSSAPAAQQLSSLISVPLIVLAFSVASSTVGKAIPLSRLIGAVAWGVALPILAFGSRAVSRERLLGLGSR